MSNFSFGKDSLSDSNVFLKKIQQQFHEKLLSQEPLYNQLRQTGREAPAILLNILDTGLRLGDHASMLHFDLEVRPAGRTPFRSVTQSPISDASRPSFLPGVTVVVKYNPEDLLVVAFDHADFEAPRLKVMTCHHCGTAQTLQEGQSACSYCGRPI